MGKTRGENLLENRLIEVDLDLGNPYFPSLFFFSNGDSNELFSLENCLFRGSTVVV